MTTLSQESFMDRIADCTKFDDDSQMPGDLREYMQSISGSLRNK